ncbi:uncharacterized protein LOC101458623 isoform X1 [Ceratitis capitata]|nr:uncharacterized protein LOC101458623 isoform X1 [Ceratitis capitata]
MACWFSTNGMSKPDSNESLETEFSTKCSLKILGKENKPMEFVPLLLRDVRQCKLTSSPSIFEAFSGSILLRTIVVHARVVGKILPSKKNGQYRFEIDDNTAVMTLFVPRRSDDILEVQRLHYEVTARMLCKQQKEPLKALQRLLVKTRKQLDPSRISVGNKIFIFGRPSFFHDHISICGFSWEIDEGPSRIMEMAFKDELIEWYTKKYS